MELVSLGPNDRSRFERFECAGSGRLWARQVEEMVRNQLADQLAHPDNTAIAIGLVESSGDLCAIAVGVPSRKDPEIWESPLLAVKNGSKRRGLGRRLKQELIERARAAGARVVTSIVDRENEAMLQLNAGLGANIVDDPLDVDYLICTISLV